MYAVIDKTNLESIAKGSDLKTKSTDLGYMDLYWRHIYYLGRAAFTALADQANTAEIKQKQGLLGVSDKAAGIAALTGFKQKYNEYIATASVKLYPTGDTNNPGGNAKWTDMMYGKCPRGSYCPMGTAFPKKCPIGTYNDLEQKTSVDDCLPCPAGFYCDQIGLTIEDVKKKVCDAGFYCPLGSTVRRPTNK